MSAKQAKKVRKAIRADIHVQAATAPDGLAARAERLEALCRKFKAREGMLTVALVAIQTAHKKNDTLALHKLIGQMLRDYDLLASCVAIMTDRDLAMKTAMDALVDGSNAALLPPVRPDIRERLDKVLEQIAALDPFFMAAHGDDLAEKQATAAAGVPS